MNINPLGVEAYRQAGDVTVKKGDSRKAASEAARSSTNGQVTLPGHSSADIGAVQAQASPSVLTNILSTEEKDLLIKNFARFGDKPAEASIYGTAAKTTASVVTGAKVDITG